MNRYSRAVRGYDSWGELTAATDLPLAQNALLDTEANNFAAVSLYPSGMIEIPEEYDGRPTRQRKEYPAGLIPVGRGETPDKLYLRTGAHHGIYDVEMMAVVYLGDAAPETVAQLYRQRAPG